MSWDLRQRSRCFTCFCCLVRGDDISDSFVVCQIYLWASSLAIGYVPFLYHVSGVCVCVCVCVCEDLHTVDSWCAGCMWEQRESTWLRGESQTQVIALTFNSNEVLGR